MLHYPSCGKVLKSFKPIFWSGKESQEKTNLQIKTIQSVTTIPPSTLPRPPDGRLLHPRTNLFTLAQILAARPAPLTPFHTLVEVPQISRKWVVQKPENQKRLIISNKYSTFEVLLNGSE